jgi:L-fuconate dehydratase
VRIRYSFEVRPSSAPIPVATYSFFFASLIDYIAISGSMERNVLEYVDHLHEHFLYPCSINDNGRYNVPTNPHEGYRYISTF